MSRILLIDDDDLTIRTANKILRRAGNECAVARHGRQVLDIVSTFRPEIALISLVPPDTSGIAVLRTMQEVMPSAACLIVTGNSSWSSAVEALRAGACNLLEKPVVEEDLLHVVDHAVANRATSHRDWVHLSPVEPHAHLRLALRAVQFIASPADAPTLQEFGRTIGMSAPGFRNWCQIAHERPKAYLRLARALRAVYRLERDPCQSLENLVQIVDRRTMKRFIASMGASTGAIPHTVEALLTMQRLVSAEAAAAIRVALKKQQMM